jgi:hypothetical protein
MAEGVRVTHDDDATPTTASTDACSSPRVRPHRRSPALASRRGSRRGRHDDAAAGKGGRGREPLLGGVRCFLMRPSHDQRSRRHDYTSKETRPADRITSVTGWMDDRSGKSECWMLRVVTNHLAVTLTAQPTSYH